MNDAILPGREEIDALTDLADAARNACDANKHPPLTEALTPPSANAAPASNESNNQ